MENIKKLMGQLLHRNFFFILVIYKSSPAGFMELKHA